MTYLPVSTILLGSEEEGINTPSFLLPATPSTTVTGIFGSAFALEREEMNACGWPLAPGGGYLTDAAALELTCT